jgi:hypothetical protein
MKYIIFKNGKSLISSSSPLCTILGAVLCPRPESTLLSGLRELFSVSIRPREQGGEPGDYEGNREDEHRKAVVSCRIEEAVGHERTAHHAQGQPAHQQPEQFAEVQKAEAALTSAIRRC